MIDDAELDDLESRLSLAHAHHTASLERTEDPYLRLTGEHMIRRYSEFLGIVGS